MQQRRQAAALRNGRASASRTAQQRWHRAQHFRRNDGTHGVLLRDEGERPIPAGNLGFPVSGRSARRSNSATRRRARAGERPASWRLLAFAQGLQPEGCKASDQLQPVGCKTLGHQGGPIRTSRIDRGQVTTATPAALDFRAGEAADEGLQTRCPREALQVSRQVGTCGVVDRDAAGNRRRCRAFDCARPPGRKLCAVRGSELHQAAEQQIHLTKEKPLTTNR